MEHQDNLEDLQQLLVDAQIETTKLLHEIAHKQRQVETQAKAIEEYKQRIKALKQQKEWPN